MRRLGSLAYLCALVGTATVVSAQGDAPQVVRIRVAGPITEVTADYISRALAEAEGRTADAFLIELDTPGGNVSSMQRIAGALLNSEIPTLVWVGPQGAQAASAGTFVVLAADVAGMASKTTIGAASPVGPGGEDLPTTGARKATEDLAAAARGYARGRGEAAADWAERAVREAASASDQEALELGLIDVVADEVPTFLAGVDGREVDVSGERVAVRTAEADIVDVQMNLGERLLARLAHPAVALILITLGINAILIELGSPGGFVAGTLGALALALGFYSLGILEANLVGLAFMAAAFVLFVLEVHSPSNGLLMAGGIVLYVIGAVLLFADGPYGVPWGAIVLVAVITTVFGAIVVMAAVRAMSRPALTGGEALIGARGTVRVDLAPAGTVLVVGELWRAVSADGSTVPMGQEVVVEARNGHTLVVRPS